MNELDERQNCSACGDGSPSLYVCSYCLREELDKRWDDISTLRGEIESLRKANEELKEQANRRRISMGMDELKAENEGLKTSLANMTEARNRLMWKCKKLVSNQDGMQRSIQRRNKKIADLVLEQKAAGSLELHRAKTENERLMRFNFRFCWALEHIAGNSLSRPEMILVARQALHTEQGEEK